MKESYWGMGIILLGIISIAVIFFIQEVTNTDEQNYNLLRETTEAAMYDAIDLTAYRTSGTIKINREKFVENFVRRFAANASLQNTYRIEIFDVNETPPKVSLRVSTRLSTRIDPVANRSELIEFDLVNKLDAILETPY